MDQGLCDACIIHEADWVAQRAGRPEHCASKVRLSDTVASIHNTYPSAACSAQWQKKLDTTILLPIDRVCPEMDNVDEVTQVGFDQLGGPILLLLLLLVATMSVVITRIGNKGERATERVPKHVRMSTWEAGARAAGSHWQKSRRKLVAANKLRAVCRNDANDHGEPNTLRSNSVTGIESGRGACSR
eukprot:268265-Prymnesium_polylepis.2